MDQRFGIWQLAARPEQLVLVLSYPGLERANSVIVAPLLDPERFAVEDILNPLINMGERSLALATERMAAIALKELGSFVGHAQMHEHQIARALSRIFFGN